MTFLNADLEAWLPHIIPILEANHAETGVYDLPFDPDFKRYVALFKQGDLLFFLALANPDEVAGVAIFFLDTEIQQQNVRSATQSVNYMAKKHRGKGLAFMKFCDDYLRKHGVNSVWRQATSKYDVGKIYERMGYHSVETSYLKRL
jgi:GNAT superfamily N-acetyltransferase